MKMFCLIVFFLFSFGVSAQNEFIIVVNTNPNVSILPQFSSTTSSQFILPLRENTLDYEVEYQKVDSISLVPLTSYSESISVEQETDKYLISFPEPGFYRIKVTSPDGNLIRWANENSDFINEIPSLTSPDMSYQQKKIYRIDQWGNLKWTSFYMAFNNCVYLDVTALDTPDLTNVTDCFGMFLSCDNLVYNPSINNWDVLNITDMTGMFLHCNSFNQPLNDWQVDNVLSMENMFSNAPLFNQPLNNWNVGNVNNFNEMFLWADDFNQPLNFWNVTQGINMVSMFNGATSFNQSLGEWNLGKNVLLFSFLSDSGMDCSNYYETLNGWANNSSIPMNKAIGVEGLQYASNTVQPRNILINDKNWSFNGDVFSETNCLLNNSDFVFDKVVIFPNPATDFLYVTSTNDFVRYEIYDALGKKVATNDFQQHIVTQNLSQGNYILKLYDKNNQKYTAKFIKK